jgi:hypothetical protein
VDPDLADPDPDLDPAFHINADPDPASKNKADPDPQPWFNTQSEGGNFV